VIESALSVAVYGAIFLVIRKQEQIIQAIFDKASLVIGGLLLRGQNLFDKVKPKKGKRFSGAIRVLQRKQDTDIATAHVLADYFGHKGGARSRIASSSPASSSANMDTLSAVNQTKQTIYQREQLHMNLGNAMASRYNDSLMFKLFTKSFTPQDEMMIKKILGRDTASKVNVDDLNKVADFLFTTDSKGQITGLSEAFMKLVQGLGYVHNK